MKAVVCFGEAIVDFLGTGTRKEGPLAIAEYRRFPGGAPANVAVAIGKLGGNSRFAGQVGDDRFGRFLGNALSTYGVDVTCLSYHATAKTALAFVTLDEEGERSFEFFRDRTADTLLRPADVQDAWFQDAQIFHFCSNTLTGSEIAATTRRAATLARQKQCLVSFDVNLRHNLWPGCKADTEMVKSFFQLADIVKLSREELNYLEPDGEAAFSRNMLANHEQTIVITNGAAPATVISDGIHRLVVPPHTQVIDTTAAGDAFMGGFLFALAGEHEPRRALADAERLEAMMVFASKCGAIAVSRQGAFTAMPTLAEVIG